MLYKRALVAAKAWASHYPKKVLIYNWVWGILSIQGVQHGPHFPRFSAHFLITQEVLYAKNYSEKRIALELDASGI
jgi:hypothetical protein